MTGRGNATLRAQRPRHRTFRDRVQRDFGLRQRKAYYVTIPHRSHRRDVSPFPSHFDLFGKPGQFAPNLKILAILFLVLSGSIGGFFWYADPTNGLFHSYRHGCDGRPDHVLPGIGCTDPFTTIWQTTSPNSNLAEYNTYFAGTGSVIYVASCTVGTPVPCISMGSDSGTATDVALTKDVIGDLSIVAAKALVNGLIWTARTGLTYGTGVTFGFYLTTNSTVPTHDIGSTSAYEPKDDPSVALVQQFFCSSNCNMASPTFSSNLYFLRTLGKSDTIQNEDHGCANTGVGSQYMCGTTAFNPQQNSGNLHQFFLNFTGVNNGSSCGTSTGAGCSFLDLNGVQLASSQQIPFFAFQSQQYYLGFYVKPTLNNVIGWTFNTASGANELQYYVTEPPVAVPPNIDTGGFFGPIIRALIQIGVFVAQNLINFGTYLAGLFWPIFVTALAGLWSLLQSLTNSMITFFVTLVNGFESILKSLLNTIGQTLGFPASSSCNFVSNPSGCGLGDDLFQEITYLVSTVTSTIATFIGGLTNIFTAVLDFFAAITTWFATWGTYFVNAIVAIGNLVVELLAVVKELLLYAPSTFTWGAIILFIVYSSLDGLDGWFAFFETVAWILLFGVSVAEKILNWLISLSVWLVSQIPAFNLQGEAAGTGGGVGGKYMVGFDLPRLPLLEHSFRPSFPHNFTEPEISRFNIFSILGLVVGTFMLIYAVGANLVPGVNSANSVNLNLINALLPVGLTLIGALGAVTLPFLLGYLFRNVFRIGITTPSLGVQISTEKIPLRAGKVKGPGFKVGLRPSKHKFQVRSEDGRARTIKGIRNIIREGKRQSAASQERLRRETERLREQQMQQQKQREREAQQRTEQAAKREQNRRELSRTPEGFE